jgi:hypothetical protein
MALPLEAMASIEAKLARAEAHLRALENEIFAWLQLKPCEGRVEFKSPLMGRYTAHLVHRPDTVRWALIFGDCIHNLRATLDHLMYAIALHQNPALGEQRASKVAFVIANDAEAYADAKRSRKLADVLSPAVLAALEAVQPHNRPHKTHPPLLRLLRDLNDADKHRMIHPVFPGRTGTKFSIKNSFPNRREDIRVEFNPVFSVNDGAEIATVALLHPAPQMEFELEFSFGVALPHAPGPAGTVFSSLPGLLAELLVPDVKDVIGIVNAAV